MPTIYKDDVVLYYGADSPFSNLYECTFYSDDGCKYICAEQYFQYKKMYLCGADSVAHQIMAETNVYRIKRLGMSRVVGFDDSLWDRASERVLYDANCLKYMQNGHLAKLLKDTGSRTLGEASASDSHWGIGLSISSSGSTDKTQWVGENLMGLLLQRIRYLLNHFT